MKPVTLKLQSLQKEYPNGTLALNDCSLEVKPGSIFGLIGPNGAGKSTLLKVASGLLVPQSGAVICNAEDVTGDPQAAARFIGLMPDPLGVYTDISSGEYLEFFARLLELPRRERNSRIERIVEELELEPWLESEVETLSSGWQRRLALARVLLSGAPVLLLDEPAAGLDITARAELLGIIKRLADRGHSIVVSSHILHELEELADVYGILSEGAWVKFSEERLNISRKELQQGLDQTRWLLRCEQKSRVEELLLEQGAEILSVSEQGVLFTTADAKAASAVLEHVLKAGCTVLRFSQEQGSLDAFVRNALQEEKNR